jgi:hypothetical protein
MGTYRIDADTDRTCSAFARSEFIEYLVHDGGHIFPEPEVTAFLDRALAVESER